jgi:predicted RNA-binding Zn-ribbon protein involved in translation (DUF1610 family)
MSQSQMQEITCPKCGKKQFFRVWDSINTMEDPPLKKAVRNDEAFSFHCLDCGASAVLHYNFIYHEPAEKLFIVCNADGSDYTAMKETLTAEDNAFKGYTKRIVLSHNAFKEKLLIFDAGFNDKIVEVMKSGIYANVEAHYKDKGIDEIFFATKEENQLKEDTPVAFLTKLLLSHLYGALITWCMLGGSFKLSEESNQFVTEEVNAFLYKYMKQ